MKTSLRLLAISGLALYLFSCAGEVASSTPTSKGSEPFSSSLRTSSASLPYESSDKASSTTKTSLDSIEPGASSSVAVYYTVSIYQSNYIEEEGRYGNPRFDTSVIYEAGQILFSSVEEKNALADRLRPVFHPTGGTYVVDYFYPDEECTKRIPNGLVIKADLRIFYRCYD